MAKKQTPGKCWNCGNLTMKPFDEVGHGWLKCSNCRATAMPNPTKSGASGLEGKYRSPEPLPW